jgi:hypothetical protein
MWKETTDKNDPLTRNGEWSLKLSWLRSNYAPSRYSIRLEDGTFRTCFWHGNQGHDFDRWKHYLSLDEAKLGCVVHLEKMKEELTQFIDSL